MTRKSLAYIVVLMSLSLLGIGGLQWYWVKQSIISKQQEFDLSVKTALAKLVDDLHERETERMLEKELEIMGGRKIDISRGNVPSTPGVSGSSDSVLKIFLDYAQEIEIKDSSNHWMSSVTNIRATDTVVSGIRGSAKDVSVLIQKTRIKGEDGSIDTIIGKESLEKKALVFGKAVKALFIKGLSRESNLKTRLRGIELDSLLARHLKANGVDAPFTYAIQNDDGKKVVEFGGDSNLVSAAFTQPIFDDKIHQASILLHFPSQNIILLKSLGWLLGLVFLFSLIMVVTFTFTLRHILRQKRMSEIKSDFINNMTHELKTPLATIGLAVDSMRHPQVKGNEEQQEYYSQLIKTEKKRLTNHIEKILQVAKMDRGELMLKPEKFNFNELVLEVVANMELQAEAVGGKIFTQLGENIGDVRADKLHLYNVVVNLLDNAIKYSEKSPRIVLTTTGKPDGVALKVEDNGIGMSADDQKRVFETFYRAQTGDVHNVKGFGLGLSYVREIISLHKGHITIKSMLGQGSEIGFEIPTAS